MKSCNGFFTRVKTVELGEIEKCKYCLYDSKYNRAMCLDRRTPHVFCNRQNQPAVCKKLWEETRIEYENV